MQETRRKHKNEGKTSRFIDVWSLRQLLFVSVFGLKNKKYSTYFTGKNISFYVRDLKFGIIFHSDKGMKGASCENTGVLATGWNLTPGHLFPLYYDQFERNACEQNGTERTRPSRANTCVIPTNNFTLQSIFVNVTLLCKSMYPSLRYIIVELVVQSFDQWYLRSSTRKLLTNT